MVIWLLLAHFTLFMVSAFYIQLVCLKVAILVLVSVAKESLICLSSYTKCKILYLVYLNNQPLLFDILMRKKFRYDSYLTVSAFILLSYLVGITAKLSEYYNFFWLKYERLGGPPSYILIWKQFLAIIILLR